MQHADDCHWDFDAGVSCSGVARPLLAGLGAVAPHRRQHLGQGQPRSPGTWQPDVISGVPLWQSSRELVPDRYMIYYIDYPRL